MASVKAKLCPGQKRMRLNTIRAAARTYSMASLVEKMQFSGKIKGKESHASK